MVSGARAAGESCDQPRRGGSCGGSRRTTHHAGCPSDGFTRSRGRVGSRDACRTRCAGADASRGGRAGAARWAPWALGCERGAGRGRGARRLLGGDGTASDPPAPDLADECRTNSRCVARPRAGGSPHCSDTARSPDAGERGAATPAPVPSAEPVAPALADVSPAVPAQEARPVRAGRGNALAGLGDPAAAAFAVIEGRRGAPGLILVAATGDTIPEWSPARLSRVGAAAVPAVVAANPRPLHPGTLVVFPAPPEGWASR